MNKKIFCILVIITTLTSCEFIRKKIIEKTTTYNYSVKKYGHHINRFYPRACYGIMFNEFKRNYKNYTSDPEKNKILSKIKYKRNKLFIFSINASKPQPTPALNIKFTLQDSKNTIIKNQSFSYSTRIINRSDYGYVDILYRYEFMLVLEEKLSKKNMEKDRWPMFLTIKFPDKKFIKYKLD